VVTRTGRREVIDQALEEIVPLDFHVSANLPAHRG
jgi:hypothetical protein